MYDYAKYGPTKDYDGATYEAKTPEKNNSSILGTELKSIEQTGSKGGLTSGILNSADKLKKRFETFGVQKSEKEDSYDRAFGGNKYSDTADEILNSDLYKKHETPKSRMGVDEAYRDLENFDYDPEADSMFRAYRDRYLRESEQAQDSTMANLSSFTGGRNNSWATQAVAQVGQSYAQKIADVIPILAESAYNKLLQKYNVARDIYEGDVAEQDREFARNMQRYDVFYNADRTAKEDARAEKEDRRNDVLFGQQVRQNEQAITLGDITNEEARESLNQMIYMNSLDREYAPREREVTYWQQVLSNQGIDLSNDQMRFALQYLPAQLEQALTTGNLENFNLQLQNHWLEQGVM